MMKQLRAVLAVVLSLTLLLSGVPCGLTVLAEGDATVGWNGSVATAFESGTGTEEDPYVIVSGAQLAYFAQCVNGYDRFSGQYVELGADILLNDVSEWETWGQTDENGLLIAPANVWTPIGNYVATPFGGTFDGNGYTIRGLYVRSSAAAVGLFGELSGATVRNVKVEQSAVIGYGSSYASIGGVVGNASDSTVTACVNRGFVSGSADYAGIGGVCGQADRGEINGCENSGTVQGGGVYANVGGVCGQTDYELVTDCVNSGAVSGEDTRINVGGVIGSGDAMTVRGCENRGAVSGDGVYANVGGVCGYASAGLLWQCQNLAAVDGGTDAYVGGVCGYTDGEATVDECRSCADLSGASLMGGVSAYVGGGSTVTECYSIGTYTNGGEYTEIGGIVGELYDEGTVSMCYAAGSLQSDSLDNLWGGIAGDVGYDCLVEDCYYPAEMFSTNNYGVPVTEEEMQMAATFDGWNFRSVWEFGVDETNRYPTLRVFGSQEYLYRVILKDGDKLLSTTDYLPQAVIDLTPPASDTYEFAYWRTEEQERILPSQTVTATEDLTLTAVWRTKRTTDTSWDGTVDTAWDGSGTEADPYRIGTPAELAGMAAACQDNRGWDNNTYFKLTADLVINEGGERFSDTLVGRYEWTPIGSQSYCFCGVFDGNGHTISGVYLESTDTMIGLFGALDGGTIRNLTLTASYLKGTESVGGIVGSNRSGIVESCVSDASVYGERNVGGVCGYSDSGTLTACRNSGTVQGTLYVGGVCGYGYDTRFGNCRNDGAVTGHESVGGVIGYMYESVVENAVNNGTVCGTSCYIGGVAGRGDVVRSVNYGTVEGFEYVGGVCGYGSATDSYSVGAVSGTRSVGGLLGYGDTVRCYSLGTVTADDNSGGLQYGGNATDSYYLDTVAPSNGYGTALTAEQLASADSFENWNFLSVWEIGYDPTVDSPTLRDFGSKTYSYRVVKKDGERVLSDKVYPKGASVDLTPPANDTYDFAYWRHTDGRAFALQDLPAAEDLTLTAVWSVRRTSQNAWDGSVDTAWEGSGTADDPYRISSAAELAGVAALNDAQYGWNSSTYFLLTADILLNDGGAQFDEWLTGKHAWTPIGRRYAFNGCFDGGGHTVTGLYCYETADAVGLFGKLNGTVTDLNVVASYLYGKDSVGAVVGSAPSSSATVIGCTADSTVVGENEVGGVVGSGRATSCTNRGTVSGQKYVGGVVGEGPASNCTNLGDVRGDSYVGGVVGFTYDAVNGCLNEGTVSGEEDVGGLVGSSHGAVSNGINLGTVSGGDSTGGIIGTTHGEITNSYNSGTVSGKRFVGGLVGYSYDTLINCYNNGEVVGTEEVGGICGVGYVTTCYNSGTVSGREYIAAVSPNNRDVTDCYYLLSDGAEDSKASALTAEQMKAAESFVGFDFETYWTIDPTAEYPYPTLTGVPHQTLYTVTYKDTDGTVLMTERVRKGGRPSYAAPYSALLEDDDCVYRFEGWDTDTDEVLSDLTVTAVRSKIEKQVLSPIRLTMTVEQGYSRDNLTVDLESMFRQVIATSHTGYRVMSEVAWDMTAYDPDVSGIYVLEGELSLLQSPYYRSEDSEAITLTVTVTADENSAAVFREEDLVTEDAGDGTVTVVGYNGTAQRVVIPAVLNGHTVTAVADGAFRDHGALLYVSLPVSVTAVGEEAFAGCTALCEVALPEGLQSVGARAFYDTALTSVTCGDQLTSVGEYAFGFGGETATAVSGFTVCGYADSAAASYAETHGFGYVVTKRVTDEASDVQAVVQEDVTLAVVEVTDGEAFEAATQILEHSDGVVMYDFTVYNTEEERVHPDSMITFSLPLPSAFEAEDCRIYRVNEDGSFKNMNAQILDGRLVFQTSHLSYYAVIDAGEGRMLGDIDGSQAINMMDAFLLYAAMSGKNMLDAEALTVSDFNGDGTVNMMDALLLYKIASGQ